ncbi:ATP-dependent helicase [Novosphingobium sp.]|uniref:ATP-dependent helicase n=1 Tax=Novosphingobium sp. TaxID=1874826 RepID=UPI00263527AC|nr:ATP-dependent helicase [Novosphingobium sp.]
MSDRALYLRAAEDLRPNERQWEAYQSTGHCVLLAGPGSGKTKTLTIKLARMLSEDVDAPRGLACITYNTECARELETRLEALGIAAGGRVFIGTVHSFSLTQVLLPYAKVAGLGLPDDFSVATQQQARGAFERAVNAVLGGVNPNSWRVPFDRYRRSFLDRSRPEWQEQDANMANMVETYEADLRSQSLIDFDDMPLLAVRALAANPWLQKALVAKYPILAVDEYQDLGLALHGMVMGLCFSAGMRLFAVGDADQSIYGFIGANPRLLRRLSQRDDVETIRLGLNYRCGTKIVTASEYALGEARGYTAPEGTHEGTVYFHPCSGGYAGQAEYLIGELIPEILARRPDTDLGQIAILYQAYFLGDEVAAAAAAHGYAFIRTDNNALYPRGSRLMRFLEQCAMWCCGGWRTGTPRLSRVIGEGARIFHEVLDNDDDRLVFQREVTAALWERRDGALSLHDWLVDLRDVIIAPRVAVSRSLDDELATLNTFVDRMGPTGDVDDMLLGEFAGIGIGLARLNLSSLHSAKGREFDVVVLFGAEEGRIPRNGADANEVREARRLFYVGFTRARHEIHLMYGQHIPSRFVTEIRDRIEAEGD